MAGGGGAVACSESGGLVTCKETGGALACADGKPCSVCQGLGKSTPTRFIVTISGSQNMGRYGFGDWEQLYGDLNGTFSCEQTSGCAYHATHILKRELGSDDIRTCSDQTGAHRKCGGDVEQTDEIDVGPSVGISKGKVRVDLGYGYGGFDHTPANGECVESFDGVISRPCENYCGGCTSGICGEISVTVTPEY